MKVVENPSIFFEIMIGGISTLIITVWVLYFFWKIKLSKNSEKLQEMLPWMFSICMIIIYLEVFKGLVLTSEIDWIETREFQLDLITAATLFIIATLNISKGVVAYVDIEIARFTIKRFKFLPEQHPFNLVLAIYVLFLSKYFYRLIGEGLNIAFLYASISFTFFALFFLSYRISKIASENGKKSN